MEKHEKGECMRIIIGTALCLTMAASPAAAQTMRTAKYDADQAMKTYNDIEAHTQPDTSADARKTSEFIRAMIPPGTKGVPNQMIAGMGMRMAFDQSATADPSTFGVVAPGKRRDYVLRVHVASTNYIIPQMGEPYHLAPLESYYPILTVPAIQSMLSGTWVWKVSQGALSVATHAENRTKVSSNLDRYEFSDAQKANYEKGVPGSSTALARWNETVPFEEPAMARFHVDKRNALLESSRQSKRATPRRDADAYSVLAKGIATQAMVYADGVLLITVANATDRPFTFAPQDYVYLPGRLLSPLVAEPFRKGPLPMRPAAACILNELPKRPGLENVAGEESPIEASRAAPRSATEKARDDRRMRKNAGDLASAVALFAPVGTARTPLAFAAKVADQMGKAGDAFEFATGRNMMTLDQGDRADAAKKMARSKILGEISHGKGPLIEQVADKTGKHLDMADMAEKARQERSGEKSEADLANDARDAAEERQIRQERVTHDSYEQARILSEFARRERVAKAAADNLQRVADTTCAGVSGM